MLTITRTDGADACFCSLTRALDEDLRARYGAQMDFFGQFNHSLDITTALVVRLDGEPGRVRLFQAVFRRYQWKSSACSYLRNIAVNASRGRS